MNRTTLRIAPWSLLVIILLAFFSGCRSDEKRRPVQSFNLETLDGGRFYLDDQRGKILILVFWSVHCAPCHVELKELASHPLSSDPMVRIKSICVDPEESAMVLKGKELTDGKIDVLLDPRRTLAHLLGVNVDPTTLIIDANGKEFSRVEGYDDFARQLIERNVGLLKEEMKK